MVFNRDIGLGGMLAAVLSTCHPRFIAVCVSQAMPGFRNP